MTDPDVCIVGAGAGGGVAAWALAHQGARVLLLDAGPRFDPRDYDTHRQDWEISDGPLEAFANHPDQRTWESAPGQDLDPAFAHLASRSPTSFAAPPPAQRRRFDYRRALGLGGSTLRYQGEAHRFPAHAFRMRSERGVAADWPLDYEELAPYYDRVERLLDVAGSPRNPFKPPRGPYPHPPHPLSAASRQLARGAQRLGWTPLSNPLAILAAPRAARAACHYCNGCSRGCQVGAKSSVDVAVLPDAERTGRLEIRTRVRASHFELARDGRVTAVVAHDAAGRSVRERARAFVLAAGAIESPRMLLFSAGGPHPRGVGNASDQLGRNLMETLYVSRYGFFERPLETYAGVPIDSRIWDFNGARPSDSLANGYVLGQACGPFEGPVGTALEGIEGFGAAHREAMRRRFGAGIALFGIAEQLPRPENRVVLSERVDGFGVPLARIETRLDADDQRALSRCWERLGELAEVAGVELVGQASAYDRPVATHVAGTCRMGAEPETSVVDADGTVHGAPNLVVADASVLVTEGAGDSPSLTIHALALRAAEALARRARRGEL